jgi:hypothetical protein
MNLTRNKWYLMLGILLLLAFVHLNRPAGTIPWVRLGPMGLMSFIGGVAFLFLPAKIKLK